MKNELVNAGFIPYELTFNYVMGRLKQALGVSTDSELCGLLGMSTSNYANRKRSESIPYELILPLAISRSVSVDWLLTGTGPSHLDGRKESLAPYPALNIVLLGDIASELARAFMKNRRDVEVYAREGRKMAQLTAVIYNKVAPVRDVDQRLALVRADAELLAAVDSIAPAPTSVVASAGAGKTEPEPKPKRGRKVRVL